MPESGYRQRCFSAKGDACEICGSTTNVVAHHLDGDRENEALDNLVPLCRPHHSMVHHGNERFSEYVEQLPESAIITPNPQPRREPVSPPPDPKPHSLPSDRGRRNGLSPRGEAQVVRLVRGLYRCGMVSPTYASVDTVSKYLRVPRRVVHHVIDRDDIPVMARDNVLTLRSSEAALQWLDAQEGLQ